MVSEDVTLCLVLQPIDLLKGIWDSNVFNLSIIIIIIINDDASFSHPNVAK